MKQLTCVLTLILTLLFSSSTTYGAYKLTNEGLVPASEVASLPIPEHFQKGVENIENKQWNEAVRQFKIVHRYSADNKYYRDSLYYLGVAYYHQQNYQYAIRKFNAYLKQSSTPKYFENVMKYKFAIAQEYQSGAKKYLFGWSQMPKWVPAKEDAIEIYDQIAMVMPGHEMAAKALFAKAGLLEQLKDYEESAEAYQVLIQRFPKSVLSAKSFSALSNLYLTQSQLLYKDPDLLTLANINLKHFQRSFPRDIKITEASENLRKMQEIYAKELYKTAELFVRMEQPKAAALYYYTALLKFPNTKIAEQSKEKLKSYKGTLKEIGLPDEIIR
jgi:outer membrane protein assembly factor BamD (BamD/ComL family)